MTVVSVRAGRALGLARQLLMVVLINIPTVSLGLAMGWVSLASGDGGDQRDGNNVQVVVAAAVTFAASLAGVPLSALAITAGRKFATIATSLAFVVCWSLKLWVASGGGWGWLLVARVAAGLGSAGAYCIAPLLASEMCEPSVGGAAVAALVLAHNTGILLMYGAADLRLDYRTILWSCLLLAALHCVIFLFVPESPSYLAANQKHKEARASLAWLRGVDESSASLAAELAALPPPDRSLPALDTVKELVNDPGRRRAFIIAAVAVVGQESCGIFTLIQFAERTFVLVRDERVEHVEHGELSEHADMLVSPASYALALGVVQLVASALAIYLVERVGRRPLIVWTSFVAAACMAVSAASVASGASEIVTFAALATAVVADNVGMQPASYALLIDMFHYEYRSCAMLLVSSMVDVGNGVETVVFPWAAAAGGLAAALAACAALALAFAVFAARAVPETRGRKVDDIYHDLLHGHQHRKETALDTIQTDVQ